MNGVCWIRKESFGIVRGLNIKMDTSVFYFVFIRIILQRRGSITQVRGVRSTHVIVTEEYRFVNYIIELIFYIRNYRNYYYLFV